MKVQLVVPQCENPGARLIRGWPQPLGVLSIATYLGRRNPDIQIEILDGTVLSQKEIENKIDADIVGITTITRSYPNALRIAEKAKERGARVVLGGQHANALSVNILKNRLCVDAIVRGDGEAAFSKYVSGASPDSIPNLVYRGSDQVIRQNPVRFVDVHRLPIPERSLLNLQPYDENYASYVGGPFKRAGTICSQRGCRWRVQPHGGCVFCAIPDSTWRPRRPKDVWREVEQLAEYGFEFLYDVTDDIAADDDWLQDLANTRPPLRMFFTHYLSASHTNERTIEALLKIGSIQVFIGFESADQGCLAKMGKEAGEEENMAAVRVLQRYPLHLIASFVGGAPGETRQSLNRTLEFAEYVSELPITDRIHWDTLKPIPGSRAFRMLSRCSEVRSKYQGKDMFDMEEARVDWVRNFCEVDYDYLCSVEEKAEKLLLDVSTYAPLP